MSPIARIVLLLWLPLVIYFFRIYPTRKAILISLIGGILFLPKRVEFSLPLIPNYDSYTAITYAILIGLLLYDTKWLTRLEPWWLDIPMLIWCFTPLSASLHNDLGFYDGINESMTSVWLYGFPYLFGRVYFNNLDHLRDLALAIVKGALIYVPFCIWEGLMSPRLHINIYGYSAHTSGIRQAMRLGGYRPIVFMSHGLELGLFITTATLIAVWLWQSKAVREIWGIDPIYIVFILVLTLFWCRSTGAIALFFYGLIILGFAKWRKSNLPLLILTVAIVIYLYTVVQGIFDKISILEFLSNFVPSERIQSLEFRLDEETVLAAKAREEYWFGWGGWKRNRVFEENFEGIFEDISVTDSMWILAFGSRGVFGITSLTLSLLLPPLVFTYFRHSPRTWLYPRVGAAAALSALLPLFMFDNLLNNFVTAIGWVICGGVTGLVLNTKEDLSITGTKDSNNKRKLLPETIGKR